MGSGQFRWSKNSLAHPHATDVKRICILVLAINLCKVFNLLL